MAVLIGGCLPLKSLLKRYTLGPKHLALNTEPEPLNPEP